MILSEFLRVVDLSWEEFLWGSLWAMLVIVLFNTLVIMTIIPMVYDWMKKHLLPKMYDSKIGKLQVEVKSLKVELEKVEGREAEYRGRLTMIYNSAEVRGE